jgi:hypothetical protein
VGGTTSWATAWTFQRKTFYAKGRFWVFYADGDGNKMVYASSADGISWTQPTIVRYSPHGERFSVWFDGTYVHYAYCGGSGSGLYYRRGTPNSDGTITWASDEITVLPGVPGRYRDFPTVAVDSNGYPWIGYSDDEGIASWYFPFVIKATKTDGTSWDTPTKLSTTDASWNVSIIPLTSGKMLAVYAYDEGTIRAKAWDGSNWRTEVATVSSARYGYYYSVVAQGDDAHLTFLDSSGENIRYVKYTYASNSFGTETILQSASYWQSPTISINTATNDLYVFWANYPTNRHIYYRKYTASTGTWEAIVDWIADTEDISEDIPASFYQAYGGYIGLAYMTLIDSQPYHVKFAYLSVPVGVYSVTVQEAVRGSEAPEPSAVLYVLGRYPRYRSESACGVIIYWVRKGDLILSLDQNTQVEAYNAIKRKLREWGIL